ncbi:hypothetical protein OOU_Y34scaffold00333g1 [Pyricularia oryzae Y34]|uniref:Uncharacterized protein n=1 Tax=Pyricularia oryzae (strain Y34) TaxID=1143189 RepID=A0AA97PN94_PYRO3|nr:hypothetical protein OOU_Y34scaffold00333g1 [Pyricularia oryzae Y34]
MPDKQAYCASFSDRHSPQLSSGQMQEPSIGFSRRTIFVKPPRRGVWRLV